MPSIRDDDIIYVSKDPHRTFLPQRSSSCRYPPPRKKARAAPAADEASSSQQVPPKPPQPEPPPKPQSLPPTKPSPQPVDDDDQEVIELDDDPVASDSSEGSHGEAEASAEASTGSSDGEAGPTASAAATAAASDDDDDTACAKCGRREVTDANPMLLCDYENNDCNGCVKETPPTGQRRSRPQVARGSGATRGGICGALASPLCLRGSGFAAPRAGRRRRRA